MLEILVNLPFFILYNKVQNKMWCFWKSMKLFSSNYSNLGCSWPSILIQDQPSSARYIQFSVLHLQKTINLLFKNVCVNSWTVHPQQWTLLNWSKETNIILLLSFGNRIAIFCDVVINLYCKSLSMFVIGFCKCITIKKY